MIKAKKGVKFQVELFVTQESDGDNSYFLLWEDAKSAVQSAQENETQVAVYNLERSGEPKSDEEYWVE